MVSETSAALLDDDRLFPADPSTRAVARRLYAQVQALPIVSPHGHTDPRWYAEDLPFPDPATLFVVPDHYIFRMLYSQGVRLEELGVRPKADEARSHSTRARSGDASPKTIISSAARRRACGSTMCSRRSSVSRSGSHPRTPTSTSTASPRRWRRRSFVRALCSSASTSRRSPPPTVRSTPSLRMKKSAHPAGGEGGPGLPARPVVDPDFEDFQANVEEAWRHHRLRYTELGRISRSAPEAPGLSSNLRARRRPITGILPRAPPIFRRPTPPRFSRM